jgi:regulator of sigma E protease
MSHVGHLLQTLASFALVLGVLVSIHELGHYIAARWAGIRVEAFSIGFGPALKSWVDRRGTVWKICALPLGGYVKMYGMSPDARAEAAAAGEVFNERDAYCAKPVGKRAIVAAAGPVANFLLAIVLYAALSATIGRPVAPLPVVGEVVENTAAAKAGLRVGDDIKSVDGVAITTFDQLRAIVSASADKDVKLTIGRDGTDLVVPVHILPSPGAHPIGQLGVTSGKTQYETVGPLHALGDGFSKTWEVMAGILVGLAGILSSGNGLHDLGGPIMIADVAGKVARQGFAELVGLMAFLSVNLGLVNLLPIPLLDGGHLMFYAAEAVRGRPVPIRAQEYGYRVGICFIASVFVFVSWNDLVREGAFKWVAHLAG